MKISLIQPAIAFLSTAIVFSSCSNNENKSANTAEVKGIDLSYIDSSYKPVDDFYMYANNGWLKNNPVPATESTWGTFNLLKEEVNDKLKVILETASANTKSAKGSSEQLIGDYYASGMDTVSIEKDGLSSLKETLDKINLIKDKKEISFLVGELHKHLNFPLFGTDVGQDARYSDRYVVGIGQGGLGLPDRDYYFRKDDKSKMIRENYLLHVANVFELMGETKEASKKNAEAIMKLETSLAQASWTNVENRDPIKTYNKKSIAELNKLSPSFNWSDYFVAVGINKVDSVVVGQPSFFAGLDKAIKTISLDDWKKYLSFGLVDDMSSKLNASFEMEHFDFYDRKLRGAKQMKPRWKRVLAVTDRALGEALGKIFVDKHFPAEAKKRVTEMVDNLILVYNERINTRDWMSDSTKMHAHEKLDKVMKKLGYPDNWKDYTGLEINRNSYVKNTWNSNAFRWNFMVNKLGKPIDRTEWGMSPPTINAYYNPSMNEIVFPAGIMQYPFFDINQDDALNYAAMGAVIGHELTHGFDDQGSRFDADGNMVQWWTAEDNAKFKVKTELVAKQYSDYVAIDTLHLNGHLTLGENIADIGGLTIAYYAYKKSLEGKEPKTINGFTPEQRFFFGWARGWCVNYTPEFLSQQVLTNPHSPGNFRVLGPLSNMKEFYDAYDVKEGNKMYRKPEDRAVIW